MQDTVKYLIHADITANGVVERSDVVGAVFGQTEGLLGDDLDLRDLQESSKIGRIDVEIDSESGQSFGEITIGSRLDRVETAILAAALETIERVGPCRASASVKDLEDVRSAKRREVVERAKELLADFEDASLDSQDLVEEVRESIRVEDITEYEGFPAGPRVAESDAIVVVEGRADVLTLLRYGVKNAVAVEGTNVPDAIAELTQERTVTTFLDGDRGGNLILKELAQVGDVDYVAFAPEGRSVEDLDRGEVMAALREKVPFEVVDDSQVDAIAATDGSTRPAPPGQAGPESQSDSDDEVGTPGPDVDAGTPGPDVDAGASADENAACEEPLPGDAAETETAVGGLTSPDEATEEVPLAEDAADDAPSEEETGTDDAVAAEPTSTLPDHVEAVIGESSGEARFLDDDFETLDTVAVDAVSEALTEAETVPATVVLDADLEQRVLDVAAQRGVGQIVARGEGEFVKKPTSVRIRTAADV